VGLRLPGRRATLALPDDVRTSLRLEPGERVLAVAADPEQRLVVATDRDLLLQRRPPEYDRIGWESVDRATFDDGLLRLTGHDASNAEFRLRVPLEEPGELPRVVRDRVTSSIVLSQHVALRAERGVRVTARRRPGTPGLLWRSRLDDELDSSPELVSEAESMLAAVRRESGLDPVS
jgi:hypothetical protein